MSRVLFLPLITRGPAIGTITRCLAIAEHLRLLGHETLFLTSGEGAKYVSEAGFDYLQGVAPDPAAALHPLYDLSDVAVFLNLTREEYLRRSLDAEQNAVESFHPDVLFSEFKLTAPITAAQSGLPLVSTACSPADPRFVSPLFPDKRAVNHEEAIAGFNRILEERDLAPVKDVAELFFMRSNLKVAPTIQQIEPLLADVPNLHYVGYLLYDRRELAPLPKGLIEKALGRNLVFAYFGTGEISPAQYTKVLPRAYDGTEFHAIVAVGDHPDLPYLPDPTENVTWVRFVPGRSILRCSQALIFHGGQNTAMASLIHKVPSLVFPGADFERDFNARALAGIGVGIHCAVEDFTPNKLLEKTRQLLSPSYGMAAETYSREILKGGGARQAADLVIRAAEGNF
ncbi:MAG: nucleotide disphospho-sugar-binding domain-containing protein [Desulfomonilaceae bacterium]